jgi:hypothetical protein
MQETGKEINPSYAASVWQVLFFPDLSGFYFFVSYILICLKGMREYTINKL